MKISSYADLNGKRIGLTRATTNDQLTTRKPRARKSCATKTTPR